MPKQTKEITCYRYKDAEPIRSNLYILQDELNGMAILHKLGSEESLQLPEKDFRRQMTMCVWSE